MDAACTLTAFCRVDATRSIADDARKMDATLMLVGRRFGFGYSLLRHRNARMGLLTLLSCYMVVTLL